MKTLRSDKSNKLIFAHININSNRNKFDFLSNQMKGDIDVSMVFKTKIDISFPIGNFVIDAFSTPYWLDHDSKGGGITLYFRGDVPSNLLVTNEKSHIESFHVKMKFA